MKYLPGLTLCWLLAAPSPGFAAVVINEIAWMGDSNSANHEWIELYNTGATAVNITSWQLRDAGNLKIDLNGTISPGAYVVLERNRSSEQYVFDPPFLVYTGALVNSGTTLTLYHADGSVVNQVVGGENWQNIGGDNATKETAQYTGTNWVTAPATPGAATIATASTPPATGTSSAAPLILSGTSQASEQTTRQSVPDTAGLVLDIIAPQTVYVGQPATFRVSASGVAKIIHNSLKYNWNFGDTHSAGSNEATHTYDFPGQYVVSVQAAYAKYDAIARHTIIVLPIKMSLDRAANGDVHIHNDSPYEVDVSGYRLVGDSRVVFPSRSIVLPHSTVTVAWERVALQPTTTVALYDQNGVLITVPVATPALAAAPISQSVTSAAVPAPHTTAVAVPPGAPTTNFSFASPAPAVDEVPVPVTENAVVSPATSTVSGVTTTTDAIMMRHETPSTLIISSQWWTIGGLAFLLSGTILGLWWQRRLAQRLSVDEKRS